MRNEELIASVLANMGHTGTGTGRAQGPKESSRGTKAVAVAEDKAIASEPKIDREVREGKAQAKTESESKRTTGYKPQEFKYPVEPRMIQLIKRSKTYQNHTYRDFSEVPADLDYENPTRIEEMTFSEKVHDMLSSGEYANIIAWRPHGRAFSIIIAKSLEQHHILQKYFGNNRYSHFLRQLNNHGFKHISHGVDRNCYYHECFLCGLPHLCKYMPSPTKPARGRIRDPENEPNFYNVEQYRSLPDSKDHEEVKVPVKEQSLLFLSSSFVPRARASAGIAEILGTAAAAPVVDWRNTQGPPAKIPRLSFGVNNETRRISQEWPRVTMDVAQVSAALQREDARQRQAKIISLKLMLLAAQHQQAEQLQIQRLSVTDSQAIAEAAALLHCGNDVDDFRFRRFF